MKPKYTYILCLIISVTVQDVIGLDRRLQEALQNVNQDFLNFEGHKGPTSTASSTTSKSIVQNVNQKVTPAPTATSTTKQTTPGSPVKQLINNFNDKISANQNQGNRPASPSTPNAGQPGSGTPGNPQQNKQLVPNQPGHVSPQPIPNTPNANPSLPKPVPASNPVPSQPSWSSIVSGNKQGGVSTSKPHNISPANTPKTAQNLQPIDIGGGWPLPGGTTPKPEARGPEIMSDQELKDLSEALLGKDNNNPAKHITVNYQGKTTSFSKDDVSPLPLFSIPSNVWNIPTVSAMKVLYDNYEQDSTVNEHVTALEKNEENAFLDAVMATPVMRHLMSTLRDKGVVSPDAKQQQDAIKTIWFNTYSRGQGKIGSSGFEHIFLSEIKNNEISGLHNWLYFSSEEAINNTNYLGFMKKIDFGGKGGILKFHFTMKGIDKPVATMFVGTSPELELALYSLCFMTRVDKACPLSLGGQTFNLRTHNFRYRGKNMIGSAFPEI